MSETIALLRAILEEDSSALVRRGDEADGFLVVDVVEGEDGRWSRLDGIVVCHTPTGEFYSFDYEVGLTELQDCNPFEDYGISIRQVVKETKTVTMTFWTAVK